MSKLKNSNIVMISLILISLTFIFSVSIDHSAAAQVVSSNNSTNTISEKNSLLNQSITTNKTVKKTSSVLASNKSSIVKQTNSSGKTTTKIISDPQIYKNGVPVAIGSHPAGYAYPTIAQPLPMHWLETQ